MIPLPSLNHFFVSFLFEVADRKFSFEFCGVNDELSQLRRDAAKTRSHVIGNHTAQWLLVHTAAYRRPVLVVIGPRGSLSGLWPVAKSCAFVCCSVYLQRSVFILFCCDKRVKNTVKFFPAGIICTIFLAGVEALGYRGEISRVLTASTVTFLSRLDTGRQPLSTVRSPDIPDAWWLDWGWVGGWVTQSHRPVSSWLGPDGPYDSLWWSKTQY